MNRDYEARQEGSAAKLNLPLAGTRMADADPASGAVQPCPRSAAHRSAGQDFGRSRGSHALAIGIDLESSDNLPAAGDPWTEPFYLENFTSAEIAWCLRRPDHKLAFCGLWCAKEAAIKCDQGFAGLRRIEIEIVHDEGGRPRLRSARETDPVPGSLYALSISYSGKMGMAVCVKEPPRAGSGTRG